MVHNALTVDVEDWGQSTLDHSLEITDRAAANTLRMLDLFDAHGVKGTFFVLGLVAEKFPDIVREIEARGHEVASHGYGHMELMLLGPDEFRADLMRSLDVINPLVRRPVTGYRAPDFTVVDSTLWALDIIREAGLRYDSSIYPIKGGRYGIPGWSRFIEERDGIYTVPLTTLELAGKRLPAAGGGYFRIFPYLYNSCAIRSLNKKGRPAIVYLHPYELDTAEVPSYGGVPLKLRLSQHTGRRGVEAKLHRLFREFSFRPVREVLGI